MASKPQRRQRWVELEVKQVIPLISDDLDLQEMILEEHIEEDMTAHQATAEAFQDWKLSSLRAQNRMLFAVVLALIAAIVSILVPLVTR